MNPGDLDPGILLPPLLTGLVVLSTHVPLGRQVLSRGIVFIDLAIAQIAGLGVIAAHVLGWEVLGWQVQVAALAAALTGAAVFHVTGRLWPQRQEALIGSSFVLAASLGILLLAGDPHAGEQLKDLLVGQILWVNLGDILPIGLLSMAVLGLWPLLRIGEGPLAFYLVFALMVTASVQLVGVYLVFASLIFPALAVQGMDSNRGLAAGYALGGMGYLGGLVVSAGLDLPSGPLIVLALALAAVCWGLFRRYGKL